MKNKLLLLLTLLLVAGVAVSFVAQVSTKKYKCLIQLTNYKGEGAYIVASLINPEDKYEQTLQILGDNPEWYSDLTEWWTLSGTKKWPNGGNSMANAKLSTVLQGLLLVVASAL